MATIASVDKTLGRVSAWMSSLAFAGVMALAFLPARGGNAPVPAVPPTTSKAAKARPVQPPARYCDGQAGAVAAILHR